jgi:DNA-3-methyladenine glycosylase I
MIFSRSPVQLNHNVPAEVLVTAISIGEPYFMTTFCEAMADSPLDDRMRVYHDTEYGFPVVEDDLLFERLMLEVNQAGLSWAMVLRKRAGFRAAFHGFSVDAVAAYTDEDKERLVNDAGIIQNRAKIAAAIDNARKVQALQAEYGSFRSWIDLQQAATVAEWVKLFRSHFKFTGYEVVNEFLMSIGRIPGAHDTNCPVNDRIAEAKKRVGP